MNNKSPRLNHAYRCSALIAIILSIVAVSAREGLCAIATITVTGQVTSITDPFGQFTGAKVGDVITSIVTYDTSAADIDPDPNRGRYRQIPLSAPRGAQTTISSSSGPIVFTAPSNEFLDIVASNFASDYVQFISQPSIFSDPRINFTQWSPLTLSDTTGTALSDQSFPAMLSSSGAIDLSLFFNKNMFLNYMQTSTNTFGSLNASVLSASVSIPEPSSIIVWSLLGLTITGAGWWRRQKRSA
jgi:hypothetical protein